MRRPILHWVLDALHGKNALLYAEDHKSGKTKVYIVEKMRKV
jgi:hypothetical protein